MKQVFWKDWIFWLVTVGTIIVAVVSSVVSMVYDNFDKYMDAINEPPPRWVFPTAWIIIYVLTIIGTYLQIYFSKASRDLTYLTLATWGSGVLSILFWVVAVNVYSNPSGALIIACMYLAVIVLQTLIAFWMWPWAVLFYLPIIGWLSYAIYLNTQMLDVE
jgi:tryptophan-rich sensory protein